MITHEFKFIWDIASLDGGVGESHGHEQKPTHPFKDTLREKRFLRRWFRGVKESERVGCVGQPRVSHQCERMEKDRAGDGSDEMIVKANGSTYINQQSERERERKSIA